MLTIELRPAEPHRAANYGVLLESSTRHGLAGPNVHNPSFPHRVQVWECRNGQDPHGNPSTAEFAYLLSAESVAITATPMPTDPEGPKLIVGEQVRLSIHGYVIGTFEVVTRRLSDPVLVKIA